MARWRTVVVGSFCPLSSFFFFLEGFEFLIPSLSVALILEATDEVEKKSWQLATRLNFEV